MMCRKKNYTVGDTVTVKNCAGGYPLPAGLPEGARVKVVDQDVGYDLVEFDGRLYSVFMACVESGWEYDFMGRWRDEAELPAAVNRVPPLSSLHHPVF